MARRAGVFKTYFAPKTIFTAEDRRLRLGWRLGLCAIAFTLAVCLLLDHVGRFDRSRPVLAILGTVFATIKLRWRLRDRLWFWITLAVYVAVAAVVTTALSWSTDGPSRGIIGGIMGISVYGLFVVLHALERWADRTSADRSSGSKSKRDLSHQP